MEPLANQPASFNPPPQAPVKPRIGKFRASYLLATESFELLRKDKEIMLFPLIAALSFIGILAAGASLFYFLALGGDLSNLDAFLGRFEGNVNPSALQYAFVFIFYLLSFFIVTFSEVGLSTIVYARINGQDLGFRDGVRSAYKRLGKIIFWTLIASTVGVLLHIISDRSKWLGKLVAWFMEATWNIATFFIIPILAVEDISVGASIKKSAAAFKKTWGETIIMNFSMGLFFIALFFFGFLLWLASFSAGNTAVTIIASIVFVLYIFGVAILSSSLSAIFKVVLYEYANYGKIPDGFEPELILGALKRQTPGQI